MVQNERLLFNTVSFLSGEYRVTHSSLNLCSIDDDLMRVTTSLTQREPLERIMLRGGWQTDSTAMKYLRN
jgi:hypothetical protein